MFYYRDICLQISIENSRRDMNGGWIVVSIKFRQMKFLTAIHIDFYTRLPKKSIAMAYPKTKLRLNFMNIEYWILIDKMKFAK